MNKFILLFFSCCLSTYSYAEAEIFEFYPSCQFTVLDTTTMKQKMRGNKAKPDHEQVSLSTQTLLEKLINRANEAQALGIILTDKKVLLASSPTSISLAQQASISANYVQITADLISQCDGDFALSDNATKYDRFGNLQNKISVKMALNDIKLTLPPISYVKRAKQKPPIASLDISFSNGVYGVKVDMHKNDVIKVMGAPTTEFVTSETQSVFSYGRNLWVIFDDEKVNMVSNTNQWLSGHLINQLAFDDRISDDWVVMDSISKDMSAQDLSTLNFGVFKGETHYLIKDASGASISLKLGFYIAGAETELRVESFNYGYIGKDVALTNHLNIPSNPELYTFIHSLIEDASTRGERVLEKDITAKAVFSAVDNDGNIVKAYDNNFVLSFEDDELSYLSISEPVFKHTHNTAMPAWRFGALSFNQTKQSIRTLFGDDIFEMDDHWQIFVGDSQYDLYFSDTNGQGRLSSIELDFF